MNDITMTITERDFILLTEALLIAPIDKLLKIELGNATFFYMKSDVMDLLKNVETTRDRIEKESFLWLK